ncbi:exo-alpha-sialidase [Opitutaceae bacterium TAV4]|nr:exo-alpha-sialidase [Opitutaceae bacterium TAV4]RRK02686.1 exo-alpha-sialidase [Opitutaceae bacterium TAV3]
MMKYTTYILTLGFLISCAALQAETLQAEAPLPIWAAKNLDGQPVRIAVPAPKAPRFAHLSWNKVQRTPKGTVILAYTAGTFHGNDGGGSPAVSRSTDGGRTFSEPQIIREFGPGLDYTQSGNQALGIDENGNLVLLAMAFTADTTSHIFGWRSEDDGVTWKPVDTSALGPNKTGSVFGDIVSVEGQGLMVLGHYRQGSKPYNRGIWLSTSQDQGRTWSPARRISDVHAAEPVLVQTTSGRLLGFFRSRGDKTLGGRQYVGVSDDQGATWKTELSVLDSKDNTRSRLAAPFAVENPNNKGETLVLTTERGKVGETRGRIWLWRGDAQKLDWKRERVLLEFPHIRGDANDDFGYPWLLHLEGNRWLMYYYHGPKKGANPLWVTEVKL